MSSTEAQSAGRVDLKLEAFAIPVADVDRAMKFYGGLNWRLDADSPSTMASGSFNSRRPARTARSSSVQS